jgi:hypothetical protein
MIYHGNRYVVMALGGHMDACPESWAAFIDKLEKLTGIYNGFSIEEINLALKQYSGEYIEQIAEDSDLSVAIFEAPGYMRFALEFEGVEA